MARCSKEWRNAWQSHTSRSTWFCTGMSIFVDHDKNFFLSLTNSRIQIIYIHTQCVYTSPIRMMLFNCAIRMYFYVLECFHTPCLSPLFNITQYHPHSPMFITV